MPGILGINEALQYYQTCPGMDGTWSGAWPGSTMLVIAGAAVLGVVSLVSFGGLMYLLGRKVK